MITGTSSVAISSIPDTTKTTNTTNTTNTAAANSTAGASLTGVNMGKEDFLKLLTTQLRYQDPLSPEDPKDFVAQLAQFSSVEQLINLNSKYDANNTALQNLQGTEQMAQGVSLLDKTVKAQGNGFTLTNGQADKVSFILGANAKQVKVGIYNSSGQLIRTVNLGALPTGENSLTWDGKDSNGAKAADGSYTFQVSALDANGKAVDTANMFTGKVEEVIQNQNKVYLKVNGRLITVDNIVAVEPS